MRHMNPVRNIRINIFAVTQSEMAIIAGVTQSTVSRWENGVPPSLDEMKAIRAAAKIRGLNWRDEFFFEVMEAAE